MSKGGRVKYQKGKKVRDLSDPTGQTFLDPKDVPNMKVGNQEPRNNTPAPPVENRAAPSMPTGPVQIGGKGGKPLPQFDASKKQPPMSVGAVGGSGNVDLDEQFGAVGGETTQEPATPTPTTQPASPEIMRETTPPNGTYTTTNEQGEVVNLPNMLDWEEEYKKSNPRPTAGGLGGLVKKQKWDKEFEIAQQTHQADLDVANFTPAVQTSAAQQAQFEKDRRERIRETGLQIEAASTGQVPEGAIIPDAVQVGIDPETGEPIREQATTTMQDVEGYVDTTAQATTAGQVTPETVTTGQVTTAQTPEQIQAAQMEAAMVSPDAQVEAAEGEVSDQAIAKAAKLIELHL
jgi:hypothetical protein